MKRFIDVHTGEVMAGQGEVVLKSDTNNACTVIIAYDAAHKIGALAHAMFNDTMNSGTHFSNRMRDTAGAVDEMITDMTLLGADPDSIVVNMVTGENVPHPQGDPNYTQALASTLDLLRQKHMKVREDSLKDVGKRHVTFDVESGAISLV